MPPPSSTFTNPLLGQHILTVTQFTSKDAVSRILDLANCYHNDAMEGNRILSSTLKRHILGLVFYEPSTRTLNSFDSAMKRLGGKTTILHPQYSSVQKGESLEDTIQMMCAYSDAIVLRHPEVNAFERAVAASRKPIINAGDGTGMEGEIEKLLLTVVGT
jgi:aspartate carbamoyltransferase catalytic subunit